MTELGVAGQRVIVPDAPQYNATVVRRVDMHESLAYVWVKFDGGPTPFLPGQYMTIGVFADGRLVQRPYSVASDPATAGTNGYEFYVRLVQGGQFTPLLWKLPVGHGMRMIGPKGKFTLEPDDDRTHVFISTGTGNAPFVAMMRAMLREGQPRRAIFINGVSYVADLGYRDLVEGWVAAGEYPVTYVPTVSRPNDPANAGWTGWTGRTEAVLPRAFDEFGLTPENSIAYICGNPDMILAAEATLLERGFPEAQVKKELYWPKGKEPRSLGSAGVAVPAGVAVQAGATVPAGSGPAAMPDEDEDE
ncbi:MAG TPA: FAD-binding oxidoreductase [Candidatus Saccharimonadales bacterium]|nr:FAD-binding oxidoreductase [Candidatus Saccharimonadales bacterium]